MIYHPIHCAVIRKLVFILLVKRNASCTHEGGGLGRHVTDITKLCPRSTVLDGLAVREGNVKNAQNEVSDWLRKTGMIE